MLMLIKRKSIIWLLVATFLMTSTVSAQILTQESNSHSELVVMTDTEMWYIEGGGWLKTAALAVRDSACWLYEGAKKVFEKSVSSIPRVTANLSITFKTRVIATSPDGSCIEYETSVAAELGLTLDGTSATVCGVPNTSQTVTQYDPDG